MPVPKRTLRPCKICIRIRIQYVTDPTHTSRIVVDFFNLNRYEICNALFAMIKGYNLVGFHYFNSLVKFKDQDKVATFRNGFTVYTNDLKKIEIEAFFSNF